MWPIQGTLTQCHALRFSSFSDDNTVVGVCPCSYVHGGYELLLNSYRIDYFKNTWLGADAGNRHNMEVRDVLGTAVYAGPAPAC